MQYENLWKNNINKFPYIEYLAKQILLESPNPSLKSNNEEILHLIF
jgi:hypothetical protein